MLSHVRPKGVNQGLAEAIMTDDGGPATETPIVMPLSESG